MLCVVLLKCCSIQGLTCSDAGPNGKIFRRENRSHEGDRRPVLLQVRERLKRLLLVVQVVPTEAEISQNQFAGSGADDINKL